ncbi:MAG: pyridoxal-dependent decarboxylase [Phycisphaerales bacterium]
MDPNIASIVNTFFSCNREELLSIFSELLGAMEAEESMPPEPMMSRNYETAQSSPEIHTQPGNLRDARDAVFPHFWGTDGWFSRLHLENVKGPANYASLVGALACLIKNPNLCVDTYSQRSNELEIKAVSALANLVFYNTDSPWGIFTMGGTISNFYGGKIGIEKAVPGAMHKGLNGVRVAGIVSRAAHYSNKTLAGWLGVGTDNLVSVDVNPDCSMNLGSLRDALEALYSDGAAVAFVIATFGGTDAFGTDDIAGIRSVIDETAKRHGKTVPHLHVDAAIGWTLCFLNEYDTETNPLSFPADILPVIARAREQSLGMSAADSVTIDFHKMGWGHYPASVFIANRRDDLQLLMREKPEMPYFCEADCTRDPAVFTLECSRPALGVYAVYASLMAIGLAGYRRLVVNALRMAALLKAKIEALEYCKVLNPDAIGPHVIWWVLPKGRDAKAIYKQLLGGDLHAEEAERHFGEVRRLFDHRSRSLTRNDARLSYTTDIGFQPHGIVIPAWKAVFFNPKTDETDIDAIVRGIEDL